MIQTFNVKLDNMEVRKCEEEITEINDKVYRSLQVHFDTENADRLIFKDKILDNKEKYKRGTIGTLILTINTENIIKTSKNGNNYISEKTTISIHDFVPDNEG